jgi:hypothetical protein
MLIASHLFWIRRVLGLGERFISGKPRRAWRAVAAGLRYVYLFLLIQAFGSLGYFMNYMPPPERGFAAFWIEGTFRWWLIGSWAGFGARLRRLPPLPSLMPSPSPTRRRFLEQTIIAVSAAPFAFAAYGFLYGRLDVEVTHRSIRLGACPKPSRAFASPSFPTSTSVPS